MYLVVVCGHNYSPAVFLDSDSAARWAMVLNLSSPDHRGKWVVVEAVAMDFVPVPVRLTEQPA